MPTIAEITTKFTADTAGMVSNVKQAHQALQETKTHADEAKGGIGGFIAGALPLAAVAGAGVLVTNALGGMVSAALESNKGIAQTGAVLASTHGAAGQTAASVSDLATHLMNLDGIDDDVVRSAENMLLTFTNIKGDVFPQATQTALDMSVALGQDATQSSMMLGKALNDPIAGIGALQRVGVTFTEKQKESIKTMMQQGDVAGAQAVILKELGTEFGGSAKAAGDAGGPMQKLSLMWGDMQKTIGNALLPMLARLGESLIPLVTSFGDWLPGALVTAQQAVTPVMDALQRLGPIIQGIGQVLLFLATNGDTVKSVLGALAIGVGVVLVPAFIAWAIAAGAAAVATIAATWPILAIIAAVALLVLGIKLLVEHWSQISAWLSSVWAGIVAAVQSGLQGLGKWFNTLGTVIHDALANAIQAIIQWAVGLILRFEDAKNRADQTISNLVSNVVSFFAGLPGRVIGFIANLVGGVVGGFIDMELRGLAVIAGFVSGMIDRIRGAIGAAASAANAIKDGILGALGGLAGRLVQLIKDAISNMIGAIRNAAGAVGSAFGSLFSGIHLPHFATGGDVPGGLVTVGENGPEVVALPAGSHVYPHGSGPSVASVSGGGSSGSGSSAPQIIQLVVDDAGLRVLATAIMPKVTNELRARLGVKLG